MEHTRLGTTGLQVSRICLGMMSYGSPLWREWTLDIDAARPLVRSAVEAGITFFDTADMYSQGESESLIGRALCRRRNEIVIASKAGYVLPSQRRLSIRCGGRADAICRQSGRLRDP